MLVGPVSVSSSVLFLATALGATSSVAAVHLNVLGKRSHVSGLTNGKDISYSTNITLNGEPFSVLIDTGSSDLWVAGSVPGAKSTGANAAVNYAIGSASGPIKTASMEFLGYTIPEQAFIQVTQSSSNPDGQGIVGLGPNSVSQVYSALGKTSAGDTPIDQIFRLNTSSPNFLSVLLGRSDDPDDQFPGEITVGDVIGGYENISSQPHLPVKLSSSQHWQVLLDSNGILGPDRKPLNYTTHVSGTKNKTQLTAVFDTGFSLPQVPKAIADGIYGRFEGATYQNVTNIGGVWVLPCDVEVNITVLLGGHEFPMHPLDTNFDIGLGKRDSSGRELCIGSLQPITSASSPTYDLILGMAWLRNAYMLFNYGDFLDDGNNKTDPYVQALSTTEPSEAHQDFVQVRLGGVDTTGGQRLLSSPVVTTSDPSSDSNDSPSWFSQHWIIIVIAAASTCAGLLLLVLVVCCVQRRHRKKDTLAYRTLAAPAPMPAGDMSYVAGYAPPAGPGHRPGESLNVPRHSRALSDTSTLLEHGEYDGGKYDVEKAGSHNKYPNPWEQSHITQ